MAFSNSGCTFDDSIRADAYRYLFTDLRDGAWRRVCLKAGHYDSRIPHGSKCARIADKAAHSRWTRTLPKAVASFHTAGPRATRTATVPRANSAGLARCAHQVPGCLDVSRGRSTPSAPPGNSFPDSSCYCPDSAALAASRTSTSPCRAADHLVCPTSPANICGPNPVSSWLLLPTRNARSFAIPS